MELHLSQWYKNLRQLPALQRSARTKRKGLWSVWAKNVAPDEPPEAWIGRVLDQKYEIEGVLGVGGMGMVFSARRSLVGDAVALKVLIRDSLRVLYNEISSAMKQSHRHASLTQMLSPFSIPGLQRQRA